MSVDLSMLNFSLIHYFSVNSIEESWLYLERGLRCVSSGFYKQSDLKNPQTHDFSSKGMDTVLSEISVW